MEIMPGKKSFFSLHPGETTAILYYYKTEASGMSPVKKTTLRDIAANLGISISQASRALNRKPDVAPEIRERVIALAKKLNYRNSSGKHTKTIGVLVPWFQYSFDAFVDEIIVQTRERKLHIAVFPSNDVPVLDSQLIDGAIAVGERISSEWGKQHNIPLVVLNNFGWALDHVSSVFPDADGESRQALEHLVALGHRKIARLRGPVPTARERNRGLNEFYRIAEQYGIRDSVRNICVTGPENMEEYLRALLDEGFTAFILIPVEWISRCVKTIRESGREIPGMFRSSSMKNLRSRRSSRRRSPRLPSTIPNWCGKRSISFCWRSTEKREKVRSSCRRN